MLIQIQNCPISSRSEFIDFQARWNRSDQQPDLQHRAGQRTAPGNSCSGEALLLCKSAFSSPVTCLKWSLVESVRLPGGLQLRFSVHGCASQNMQLQLSSSVHKTTVERATTSRQGPGNQPPFPTAVASRLVLI